MNPSDDQLAFDPLSFEADSAQQVAAERACRAAKTYLQDCELEQEFALMERQIHGITH